MKSQNETLNWVLVPYAHRPSDETLEAFVSELEREFPYWNSKSNFILDVLNNRLLRDRLRKCYDAIWTTHNLVSMALYSGPVSSIVWRYSRTQVFHQPNNWRIDYSLTVPKMRGAIGWLTTGDMQLAVKERRDEFIAYYKPILNFVSVFGLPHHGAVANFDPVLLTCLPNVTQCFASASKSSRHHPSERVKLAVENNNKQFIHVHSEPDSRLTWLHEIDRRYFL